MENPNPSQTALNEMISKVRAFPCTSCGAKLSFQPGSKTLKCPYCGSSNDIPDSDDGVEELDLDTWLARLEAEHETHEQEHLKCKNCGGEQTLPANLFATSCTFCGSPITSKSYAQRLIAQIAGAVSDHAPARAKQMARMDQGAVAGAICA